MQYVFIANMVMPIAICSYSYTFAQKLFYAVVHLGTWKVMMCTYGAICSLSDSSQYLANDKSLFLSNSLPIKIAS